MCIFFPTSSPALQLAVCDHSNGKSCRVDFASFFFLWNKSFSVHVLCNGFCTLRYINIVRGLGTVSVMYTENYGHTIQKKTTSAIANSVYFQFAVCGAVTAHSSSAHLLCASKELRALAGHIAIAALSTGLHKTIRMWNTAGLPSYHRATGSNFVVFIWKCERTASVRFDVMAATPKET